MKRLLAGLTASVLLAAPALQAQELTETLPTVYFNIPFGSTQKAAEPVYGLRLTQASIDTQGGLNLFQTDRPALMDFQMKDGEVNAFTVNGLNALNKQTVVYADGSTGTGFDINWYYVGAGVLGVWALCEANEWDACHDDDSAAGGGGHGEFD
ncbi:MAG: hypothetical protein RPT95_11720 [Candidatus Sedimenticola sp. (ex Thyasira tokunagai)]